MNFAIPRRAHVFVDESKAKGYYIAAAVISPADVTEARNTLRSLRHKNSASIHFKSEKDAVRKAFLTGAATTGVQTMVYVIQGQPDKTARPACLDALIDDLCQAEASRLILEQDDSLTKADRQVISARMRKHQHAELQYTHMKRNDEPLLWVSDAVAWCYQRGGAWIAQAAPLVAEVRTL